jgi:hypothetical protein
VQLNTENGFELKLSGLAKGLYFVQGQNEDGFIKQKIIVTH